MSSLTVLRLNFRFFGCIFCLSLSNGSSIIEITMFSFSFSIFSMKKLLKIFPTSFSSVTSVPFSVRMMLLFLFGLLISLTTFQTSLSSFALSILSLLFLTVSFLSSQLTLFLSLLNFPGRIAFSEREWARKKEGEGEKILNEL